MEASHKEKISNTSQGYSRMQSIRISSYEIKTSKNNLKIPVINNIHLHSMYNPAKEAQAVISKYDKVIQDNNKVLVLGLGFAYHIYELSKKLQSYHGTDYEIVVIEPNEEVYKDCIQNNLFPNDNIKVYAGEDLTKIYSELNLVKFLIKKPVLISHPASFELYKGFFTSFLEYSSPEGLSHITKYITNRDFKSYLYKGDGKNSIDEYIQNNVLAKSKLTSEYDHLMIAFTNLSNGDF